MTKVLVGIFAALLFALPASANYGCYGTLKSVAMDMGGEVWVTTTFGTQTLGLCNVKGGHGDPTACRATYALLLAALTAAKPVDLYFSDTLTCSTQPDWSTTAFYYADMRQQ